MKATRWERLTEKNWVLSWWVGPGSVNLSSIFLLMGEAVFPPVIYLGPSYGGDNEDNGELLKRSHVQTATLSAPNPPADHCWPTLLPETPGHSQASLGQSFVGSLLLSPGSCCAQGSVCALQESIPPVLCKVWELYDGVNGDLLQEGMPYPSQPHPEPLPLRQSTADPYLHRRHSNTALSQSLWGLWVLVCTRFVWALWASLASVGFDSKCDFAPSTILLGLSFALGLGYLLKVAPAPHSRHHCSLSWRFWTSPQDNNLCE